MTAIKPHQIKRLSLSGKTTYEELKEAEGNQQRLTDRPATLPLNVLKVAPAVFQWRDLTANEAAEIAHMQELTGVLQEVRRWTHCLFRQSARSFSLSMDLALWI